MNTVGTKDIKLIHEKLLSLRVNIQKIDNFFLKIGVEKNGGPFFGLNQCETCFVSEKNLSETLFSKIENFGPIEGKELVKFLRKWGPKFSTLFDF